MYKSSDAPRKSLQDTIFSEQYLANVIIVADAGKYHVSVFSSEGGKTTCAHCSELLLCSAACKINFHVVCFPRQR